MFTSNLYRFFISLRLDLRDLPDSLIYRRKTTWH